VASAVDHIAGLLVQSKQAAPRPTTATAPSGPQRIAGGATEAPPPSVHTDTATEKVSSQSDPRAASPAPSPLPGRVLGASATTIALPQPAQTASDVVRPYLRSSPSAADDTPEPEPTAKADGPGKAEVEEQDSFAEPPASAIAEPAPSPTAANDNQPSEELPSTGTN
jgi:hypothetical protein